MKIYLDDERPAPEGWILAMTVPILIHLMKTQSNITDISLDHDLGNNELTGYDFMLWLEQQVFNKLIINIPNVTFHTANPTGRKNMELSLCSIERLLK